MKIINSKRFEMGDPRFIHIATVREGLRDFICFSESPSFFIKRKITKPFPPKPQIYVEEIVPTLGGNYKVIEIEDSEEWRAIVGLLLIEGIIKEIDLLEGYTECVAAFHAYTTKAANKLKKLKEEIDARESKKQIK